MKPRRGSMSLIALAGWLFADLLLGLTIIMLGAQAASPASPQPSPGPAASPAKSPSSSRCAVRVAGVGSKPTKISFRVETSATERELLTQVKTALRAHKRRLAGRHAGMVLTFGANGAAGDGVQLAGRVNEAVRRAYPGIFAAAATRNFHDLAAPSGSISMEIYFVTEGCADK
ncbi:hypothetical protein ACIBK9_50400 [Nonomuraea sp. NPDC050227]|uniref:hypothetical protein n=1 Tax=Nonomuraea sp. NPDC050227 TaxID=3364360 RepID=UPI0037AD6BF8